MTNYRDPEPIGVVQRFGRNVAAARSWLDITQAELATRLEIDQSYMSLIEAGKRTVDIELADRLAHALHVSLADLLTMRPFAEPDHA